MAALAERYVQGVSTRKVKAITEELYGHSFSASAISAIHPGLDAALARFTNRPSEEVYLYRVLDAHDEKVREAGVIRSQAVLIALSNYGEGQRQVLAVELTNRESHSRWKACLRCLKERGLSGVEFGGLRRPCRAEKSAWRNADGSGLAAARGIFSAMPSTICPGRPMTTVCSSCAGSTTGETFRRRSGTLRRGSATGRASTRSASTGGNQTLARR